MLCSAIFHVGYATEMATQLWPQVLNFNHVLFSPALVTG
jgi:hypothetical protein